MRDHGNAACRACTAAGYFVMDRVRATFSDADATGNCKAADRPATCRGTFTVKFVGNFFQRLNKNEENPVNEALTADVDAAGQTARRQDDVRRRGRNVMALQWK